MSLTIERHDQAGMVRSMAAYLPGGELFEAAQIPGTNFNALLLGISGEFLRAENFLFLYNSEFIPDQTTVFIEEWESALGIPDDCFPATGTNEERRLHILVKLASLGVQTVADFENLATILGFPGTTVEPLVGSDVELITNGTFDTDTAWVKGGGWTISGGTANKVPSTMQNAFAQSFPFPFSSSILEQDISSEAGVKYVVSYEILNWTAGTIAANVGGTTGFTRSENSTVAEEIVGGSSHTFFALIADDDFDGSVDNVSVKGTPSTVPGFPYPFPLSFGLNPYFVIVVTFPDIANVFPLSFPIPFEPNQYTILECLFDKLKPANCEIIYQVA